jgi:hypothetical protein
MTVVSASAACSGVPMTRSELNSPTASPAQRNRPSGTRRGSPHIKHRAGDGDRSPSRLAGTATENLRFPRERPLRMPGSTMTRGRRVSRDINTNRVAFCGDGKHQPPRGCLTLLNTSPAPSPENASRLPSRAETSCITRGRGGWLDLPRGGLAPPILCQLPGALGIGSWAALSTANSRGGFTSDIGPVDPLAGAAPENRRPRMARKWRHSQSLFRVGQ